MPRVKRGNVARKRRKKVLEITKGFRASRSKLFRPANQAMLQALTNAYVGRKNKKRDFRQLWIARINAALTQTTVTYSRFMNGLKKHNVLLNRKVLADIAYFEPEVFQQVVNFSAK